MKAAIGKSDIHINQCIESQYIAKEQINQQTTKEPNDRTGFLSTHKTKRGCYNDKKIRPDSTKIQNTEYSRL